MKEKIQEIYKSLQERLKSPFLLTFIIVWSIHNWELVYGIFTFDDSVKFKDRIEYIDKYIKVYGTYHLLRFPIYWSFLSIALYIVVSFISEGINLIYGKWIRPFLYWAIDRNKLKTEDDYNALEKRRIALQELVHDLKTREEDAAIKLNTKEKELQSLILKNDESNNSLNAEIIKLKDENEKLASILNDKDNELIKLGLDNSKLNDSIKLFENQIKESKFSKYRNSEYDESIVKSKFINIFGSDIWLNSFTTNNNTHKEYFKLNDGEAGLHFITKDGFQLYISEIQLKNDILRFTKTNEKDNRKIQVELNISDRSKLVGTENNNITITYTLTAYNNFNQIK